MSESTTIQTKYGNVRLTDLGYYQITSRKEGNHNKMLHRVIFEDFYNIKLDEEFPEGIHIHHIDGDKTNNEIWNLEPMSPEDHTILHRTGIPMPEHVKEILLKANTGRKMSDKTKKLMSELWSGKNNPMYGKTPSLESRKKMSKIHNSSGFYRVGIHKRHNPNHKLSWEYVYRENRKVKTISSIDLMKLKEKVLSKGLEWVVIDLENAKKTIKKYGYTEELLL